MPELKWTTSSDSRISDKYAIALDAYKRYVKEGTPMPIKTGFDYELKGFTFVPVYKYEVKKIVHSGPCTIVFWTDNTKTVVRLEKGKEYDEYAAFTAALAKKVYGSNSQVHKILEKKTVVQEPKKKKAASSTYVFKSSIDSIKDAFSEVLKHADSNTR